MRNGQAAGGAACQEPAAACCAEHGCRAGLTPALWCLAGAHALPRCAGHHHHPQQPRQPEAASWEVRWTAWQHGLAFVLAGNLVLASMQPSEVPALIACGLGALPLPAARYKHLKVELPDIDTADISAHLRGAFDFIEENRAAKRGGCAHSLGRAERSAVSAQEAGEAPPRGSCVVVPPQPSCPDAASAYQVRAGGMFVLGWRGHRRNPTHPWRAVKGFS